jgi:tetratricopeptide (TPR) repeat protein
VRLPALRLAFLRGLTGSTAGMLRDRLLGTVLALPADLPEAEREEICDLVALSLQRPVYVTARAVDLPPGYVRVITEPIEAVPAPVEDEITIAVLAPEAGRRRLGISNELRLLRDAVLYAVAAEEPGGRMADITAWAQEVSDSPSTALRFASAARGHALARPSASNVELIAEGLAETVAWLLHGVDPRVAEWVLARALPSPNPGRLVSTEAAILGEEASLKRAFESGLVDHLPEPSKYRDDELDLRRPLALLGALGDLSVDVKLHEVATALRPRLDPRVFRVFDRLLRDRPRPLGLDPPLAPRDFVGRDEVIARLAAIFEPAREIRTVVLHGVAGIGKTALAATLCARLADRLEPVWLTFRSGPEAAWQRVADALRIDTQGSERTIAGIPGWVSSVHLAMARRDAFIVVDDVESVPVSELPAWLPAGEGACAVLVVSTDRQPVLEQEHDAIRVSLGGLTNREAQSLVASLIPDGKKAIRSAGNGLYQSAEGSPLALRMFSGLVENESVTAAMAQMVAARREPEGLALPVLQALDTDERAVVDALAVAAPTGSPRSLLRSMVRVVDEEAVLTRLADRGLVELGPRKVSLKESARAVALRAMDEEQRRALEIKHGEAASAVMQVSAKSANTYEQDSIYQDTLLALERMTSSCRPGEGGVAALVANLAGALLDYPRGNHAERLKRVIAGYEAALAVHTKESAPEEWARDQKGMGVALWRLPVGEQAENLRRAVDAYRAAMTVWTSQSRPYDWASVQNNLGVALLDLPVGSKASTILEAIKAFRAALTVWTADTQPLEWAMAQMNMGIALGLLPTGDRRKNLRRAIDRYHQALVVYTKDTFPDDWARTQHNLGVALASRSGTGGNDDVRSAIEAFRAALTVQTREALPQDWARTQRNLGRALRQLSSGDARQNLVDAIDAFRAALSVQTEEAFPREHVITKSDLEAALAALASLDAERSPPAPSRPG